MSDYDQCFQELLVPEEGDMVSRVCARLRSTHHNVEDHSFTGPLVTVLAKEREARATDRSKV